jgi:hypothetical protein
MGYALIVKLTNTASKGNVSTEKVLTVNDLNNPEVKIDSDTSDTSVRSLAQELTATIDKQIAAKENPFETVKQLAGVLSSTTSPTRQDQLADYIQDFLAKHEDSLWFEAESRTPDQAQVNYWKAQLYASLVYNYQFIMVNNFLDTNGKPRDTTKQQLQYIELYLALDRATESHPPIPEESRGVITGYVYGETQNFLVLKNKLTTGNKL